MLKAAGALCLLAAGTLWGWGRARRLAERPRQLRELQYGLELLETEIVWGATPLREAFERSARPLGGHARSLFVLAARSLEREGCSGPEAFGSALARLEGALSLEAEDLAALHQLAACLGGSPREDQARHLRAARARLAHCERRAEALEATGGRLARYLGFCGGALVAILLL